MKALLIAGLASLTAACGSATGATGDDPGSLPAATTTVTPQSTSTAATAPPPASDATDTHDSPSASTTASADGTLQIALEIHVENSAVPAIELATVTELAEAATENGVVMTFSLDEAMLEYLATADEPVRAVARAIEDDGHQFGLHADLASMGQRAATVHLAEMVVDYRTIFGHAPLSLSGACTPSGDWVAAARANGIVVIAGVVLYCERTLDAAHYADTVYTDEIAEANAVCSRPTRANCHQPAPRADDVQRVFPWQTDSAGRWLDESTRAGAITIVPTLGNTGMECASEGSSGSCSFDAETDAAAFVQLAVWADELSAGEDGATLHLAWSTNNRPSEEYIDSLLASIAGGIDAAGTVKWVTLAAV